MAYKINDEIFFLKIDEQVEYLTQVINELYSKDIKIINTNINNLSERVNNLNETKQDKTSDELKTEVKNIVGSINELFDKIESETNRAVNSENEISTNLTEYENHVNPILDSHTSSISSINDSIRSLQDNKQSKIDEQLQTTSKEVVGAINENHDAIVTNEAIIDTKQDKTDNFLETTNKTIVGAINEVNNKIFTDENIDEITSISLEHTLKSDSNNQISGEFIITGEYKITKQSINVDKFEFNVPFFITVDEKYDTSDVVVDIEDFYYETIDSNCLSISIEVLLDNLTEVIRNNEDIVEEIVVNNIIDDEKKEEEINNVDYVTYKIYIVKENDTIETILNKYKKTKEDIEKYNNIETINIGDKIIIPTND